MSTSYEIFAAVTPGLEPALADELSVLAPKAKRRLQRGGVELRGPREVLWTICAASRLAETVRVRIGRFDARDFNRLEAGLKRIPWAAFLARDEAVTVKVTARKSALYHSGAVTDRVVRVLGRPSVPPDAEGARVWVRLVKDRATISVDAGGGLLHRRGWRQAVVRAPLRETLAAACVRLAELAPTQAVWDPFCGSGTVAIEAALARLGGPAQTERRYAFQGWPTHDLDAHEAWRGSLAAVGAADAVVIGTDIDAKAVAAAKANGDRAGVGAFCTWLAGDFAAHCDAIPAGAAVVTNPPYGKRLGGGDRLRQLFVRFGEVLSTRPDLGPVIVLVGARGFEAATGLKWAPVAEFTNRGTPTRLLRLDP